MPQPLSPRLVSGAFRRVGLSFASRLSNSQCPRCFVHVLWSDLGVSGQVGDRPPTSSSRTIPSDMPTTVPDRSTARYNHEQLLATLNERQREAVTAPDGPILVIAGPGSGKTRVICARIAHLVRTGRSEPARIAALTFTRKAANEMEQRLRTMLPAGDARAVWISTFHRLCGQPAPRARHRHRGARRFPDRRRDRTDERHAPVHVRRQRRHPGPQAAGAAAPNERHQEPHAGGCDPRQLGRGRARRAQRTPLRRLPDRARRGQRARLRRPAARHGPHAARAPRRAPRRRRPLPARAGRRVPGHEPPAVRPRSPARRGT